MRAAVEWTEAAKRDLLSIPWRSAARVDREVMHYAATSEGDLRVVRGDVSAPLRLFVRPYLVRMSFDASTCTFLVWRVLRAR